MADEKPRPVDIAWVVEELRFTANENAQGMPLEVLLRRNESPEYEGAWLLVQWWRRLQELAPDNPEAAEMLSLVTGTITEEEWPEDDLNPHPLLKLLPKS